ncbi:STAS domain-containing protein [Streptomyces rimosus]|uniref:STAS domain-containing protein n=1 Tax=Streptomyces rimosus TaxID=1927 RepID=UPI0037D07125
MIPGRTARTYLARGLTVVELRGDIDIATLPAARLHLEAVTARPFPVLLVDLRPVAFFGCQGLRLLLAAQWRTLQQRGRLYLVCDSPQILRLLDIVGLLALFQPAPTINQALADTGALNATLRRPPRRAWSGRGRTPEGEDESAT